MRALLMFVLLSWSYCDEAHFSSLRSHHTLALNTFAQRRISMLSLAKQHLQQHAAAQAQLQSAQQRPQHQRTARTGASSSTGSNRAAALADFPLAASGSSKSKGATKKVAKVSSTLSRGNSFAAKGARRAAMSKSVLKRAKQLQRSLPRPSLLERAERALAAASPEDGGAEIARRNASMLQHQSERKKKTNEAMKKVR